MEQEEQKEWDGVNRLLQHHGFKPVSFADPTENKNLAELVLLERKSADNIRMMLKTMLSDSERRQGLIQELIQSNSQLKEDVQQHQERTGRHSQRAIELEGVLEAVKVKVQDLEDSYIAKAAQQQNRFRQLQQEKRDAEKRCVSAEQQLALEQQRVSELQKQLQEVERQEERRLRRQKQTLQKIQSCSNPQPQVLDIIDVYETEVQQLQNELKCYKGEDASTSENRAPLERDSFSTSKALLKSYQEQLTEAKAHREELRAEIQRLKKELDSRPSIKELKACKQQLRRLERIVQQNNLRSTLVVKARDAEETQNMENSSLLNTDSSTSKRLLADVCKELGVQDVHQLISAVKDQRRRAESTVELEKLLHDISAVLTNRRAPLGFPSNQHEQPSLSQGADLRLILPALEAWRQQLCSLTELHRALHALQKRLLPWQPKNASPSPPDPPRTEDLMLIVDTLLDETAPDDKGLPSPSRQALLAMIAHFQKLFDVPSLSGVYPRMNEVYSRLGEVNNAMRNLRDLLQLDERAAPSEVVSAVASVVSCSGGQELFGLLQSTDIDSIILKLKEHEDFFPAFHSFTLELLRTLNVTTLDDIIPTIHSLKG